MGYPGVIQTRGESLIHPGAAFLRRFFDSENPVKKGGISVRFKA
jgi:hypothetical protein